MKANRIQTLVACILPLATAQAQGPDPWVPAPLSWSKPVSSPADISFLLEAPAGARGFIRVKQGHFVDPDGKRIRFWGVNATGGGGLPDQSRAATLAGLLAQRGINCIRFHMLDGTAPRGLLEAGTDTSSAFDPDALDRLDCFIGELKKRGIYSDLNLNVARRYRAGDGVREYQLLGFSKSLTFFDERLLQLQREYARQLLTHVNPYTGKSYADEPAVALVEFVNENSLVEAWMCNRLLGQMTKPVEGTWIDIPPSYAADLTQKYNDWLKKHVSQATVQSWRQTDKLPADSLVPRLKPSEFSRANPERFKAEANFYLDVEAQDYTGMAKFLRQELKVKSLLIGNSDHGHSKTGYPQLAGSSLLDVVDGHVYWQHPRYLVAETGKRTGFEIRNTPMVDDPLHSAVVELSRSPFSGKPYTVSEVNHPFPAEYACEGIPILAAYAALQDWDGIFGYTLGHVDVTATETLALGHFDLAPDPVKMAQMAAGSLIFLRGDISAARQVVARGYTRDEVIQTILLPGSESPFFDSGFSPALALEHQVRIASLEKSSRLNASAPGSSPLRSDTGELTWAFGEKGAGLVLVDTDCSQAAIGFCGRAPAQLKNFAFESQTPFCAVTLSSLEAKPIAASGRLLLTAGARVANTGMEWNEKRTSLTNWGKAPARIEVVRGTVTFKGLEKAQAVTLQPLDVAGAAQGQALEAQQTSKAQEWSVTLGAVPAVWYTVEVRR